MSHTSGYIKAINPHVTVSGTNKFIANGLPEWYLGWTVDSYDEFAVSASLVRLSKFGIIELMYDRTISGEDDSGLQQTPFIKKMLDGHQFVDPNKTLCITATNSVVFVNEYGKLFREACR